jgi:hypothetical protein
VKFLEAAMEQQESIASHDIAKILRYGAQHDTFTIDDLRKQAGISNGRYLTGRANAFLFDQVGPGKGYCLSAEAWSMYLTMIAFEEASTEAKRANRLAMTAIVVAIIVGLTTIAVGIAQICAT